MDIQIRPIKTDEEEYYGLDIRGVKVFFPSDVEAKRAICYCLQHNVEFMPGRAALYSRPHLFMTADEFIEFAKQYKIDKGSHHG